MAIRLFVYGTLKRGLSNHFRLAGQKYVGPARTRPLYRLLHLGWHPGLILATAGGIAIDGELWDVDEQTLRHLDEFEGVPTWFDRKPVELEGGGGAECYYYQGDCSGKTECSCWPPT